MTTQEKQEKTHVVNGVEIPDLRASPEHGDDYYLANPASSILFTSHTSDGYSMEKIWVERGLVYQDTEEGKQAAILHSKAMLGVT